MNLDNSDLWNFIPPEEKVEMLNQAHSKGVLTAFIAILIASTVAMSLKASFVMWSVLCLSPMIFQYAAGKVFRDMKPRRMLEYLAARSAARRFAFNTGGKELTMALAFRGTLERVYEREDIQAAMSAALDRKLQAPVWVSVFPDSIILLTEEIGGARLALGHAINDKLLIESSDAGGYANDKQVFITCTDRYGAQKKFKLTSRYPAALAVFEKKVAKFRHDMKVRFEKEVSKITREFGDDDDGLVLNDLG